MLITVGSCLGTIATLVMSNRVQYEERDCQIESHIWRHRKCFSSVELYNYKTKEQYSYSCSHHTCDIHFQIFSIIYLHWMKQTNCAGAIFKCTSQSAQTLLLMFVTRKHYRIRICPSAFHHINKFHCFIHVKITHDSLSITVDHALYIKN